MRIAIIGGGASGLMAAATINEKHPEFEVFLIEKNNCLGTKIMISGGGRCNLTTGLDDIFEILKKYPRGARFLSYAMHEFPPKKVCEFFEKHKVKLKTENALRVFPVSNKGEDIVKAFEKIFKNSKTKVLLNTKVLDIKKIKEIFEIILSSDEILKVDKVILTTGGQAYKDTGSEGDGYVFAKSFGHTITKLASSLTSFIIEEKFVKDLAGLSFQKVVLKIKGEKKYEFTGSIIFTHKGISGPAVFAMSSLIAFEEFDEINTLNLFIDFIPFLNYEEFLKNLQKEMITNPKKLFKNTLSYFLPRSFVEMLIRQNTGRVGSGALSLNNAEISKKEVIKIVEQIKNFPLTLIGRGTGDEFVTAGGISLNEVDSKTMESKICKNLYFAGEILDIDGFTGGFNLQAAWTTGRAAGLA
jgi:hypothetical protein